MRTRFYLLNGAPDAGNGVEHEPRESDEHSHHDEALVVGAVGVVHVTHHRGAGKGGHALEEEQQTEGVGELLRSEEISEDQGGQQDVGGAEVKVDDVVGTDRESPGDTVAEHVEDLAVVGVTHPGGVLGHVCHALPVCQGGVEEESHCLGLAVQSGHRGKHGLEVVTEGHGQPADDEARVVQEQPVQLLRQEAQDEPGYRVADPYQSHKVTALGRAQAKLDTIILGK